jgi:plasmid maintenance system antidote protein VapI
MMNHEEYGEFMERLGLTHDVAAKMLGIHERTSRKYLHDERPVPETVEHFLRYISAKKDMPDVVISIIEKRKR